MKIDTRLTKTHVATFSADDITSVAVAAVKANLGISDDASVVSAEAKIGSEGTVTVEIVEAVPSDAPVPEAAKPEAAVTDAPAPQIPMGLGGAPTA